jgi:DNA-binding Lrp family transcriptional regulator
MFVNATQGQSLTLSRAIRELPGVKLADPITGDYDIVAGVTAADLAELRNIMAGIQGLAGVLKTTTCMVLAD